jgi:putative nucleotidyltransferase-like protein
MSLAFASTDLSTEEFRDRRQQARRNGSPAWLWPEVPVESWRRAMAGISQTASEVLAGRRCELPPLDMAALSSACYTSGTGPLLGAWLESGLIDGPEDSRTLLALHLWHGRQRAKKVEAQSRELVAALVDCGVPVVVLKGGHTRHCYFPEPGVRPASDLDLLVERDSAAQAEVALARMGLECAARSKRESTWVRQDTVLEPRSIWLAHSDDPWSVDLHSSLDFSASPGAPLVRFDSAEPIETSGPWPLDDGAGVLGQPLLLLHLAVHASGGLHSLTLLRIIEIVLVVRRDRSDGRLSWDEFLHVGALTNALGAAYPALSMAEKLAPGTIPSHVLEISAELASPRVRHVIDRLEPATVHRVDRASIAEHFMWAAGFRGWARQLVSDLAPKSEFWAIYERRAWRLLRRRVSR